MAKKPPNGVVPFFVSGVGATNSTSAKVSFENRKAYRTQVFSDDLIPNVAYTWGKDRFYGKINTRGEAILPRQAFLKSLKYTSNNQNYFAMNFVADAWRDFAEKLRELRDNNVIYAESPWSSPLIHKAYQDPATIYSSYMKEEVFGTFTNIYLGRSTSARKRVKDFNTFLQEFSPFFERVASKTGFITYSGMVESGWTTPLMSGLVIEIATESYDKDEDKAAKFGDFNFGVVANVAAQYGFKIDRNIPWRLVADLSSKAMQEYMIGVPIAGIEGEFQNRLGECGELMQRDPGYMPDFYGYSQIPGLESIKRHISAYINTQRELTPGYIIYRNIKNTADQQKIAAIVFANAYMTSWTQDMALLTPYLRNMYNSYVKGNPVVSSYVPNPTSSRSPGLGINCASRTVLHRNEPIDATTIGGPAARYYYRWAYKCFYTLRCGERHLKYGRDERQRHLREATNRFDFGGGAAFQRYASTIQYIHEEFIGPFQTKFLNIETISDMLEEGESDALSNSRRQNRVRRDLY
jgi:hypothetical protein